MALYAKGDKVINSKTELKGVVIEVKPAIRGKQLYLVSFSNGSQESILETVLRKDCDISNPFERCKLGMTATYSNFLKQNTTFKIKNSTNNTISSLKASRTMFKPYQFKPLLKFLNSNQRRLLVADEVGLGKTIEAGHIMLELKARGELTDVLIVCPKSLQEKWRTELLDKFALNFKVYEKTAELIQDMKNSIGYVKAIINYEKLQLKDGNSKRVNLANFFKNSGRNFSLVLCDESHRLRNPGTLTYKGATELLHIADAAVFLSATPVMLKQEDLFNQLSLLDELEYSNESVFLNRLEENRPFQAAIRRLNSQNPQYSLSDVWQELCNSEITISYATDDVLYYRESKKIEEVFKENKIFSEINKLMNGPDSDNVRARLQYLLSSMSVLNSTFSRTRKRDVTTDLSQAERKPHKVDIELSSTEWMLWGDLIKEYREKSSGSPLGLISIRKQIASSLYAYINKQGVPFDGSIDSKFDKFREIVDEVCKKRNKKLIVFAEFIETLNYLSSRLEDIGVKNVLYHGGVDNREMSLTQFKQDKDVMVFLASAAGTEGLDLQFCDSIVNYDLPWNPMVIEQRIGRVDRIGQKSKVVNIYNMVVTNSIQESIYERLLERIGIFESTIGDMEIILNRPITDDSDITFGDVIEQLGNELYTDSLNDDEREKKLREIERAVENERVTLRKLEEGLDNSLTFDDYFKNEINRILHNNAYVTEYELKNYIESLIRDCLPTCELNEYMPGEYTFNVPQSKPNAVKNFLIENGDKSTDEKKISTNSFIMKIDDKSFNLTFTQDIAYEKRSLNFINIYHPLIMASLSYFEKKLDKNMTAFSFALQSDGNANTKDKVFFLGLYKLTFTKKNDSNGKKSSELYPIIFEYTQDGLRECDVEMAGWIYRNSQSNGYECNAPNVDSSVFDELQLEFAEKIDTVADEKKKERELLENGNRQQNFEQMNIYYDSRISHEEEMIKEYENNEQYAFSEDEKNSAKRDKHLAIVRLSKWQKEKEEKLSLLTEKKEVFVETNLLSLSCITIK